MKSLSLMFAMLALVFAGCGGPQADYSTVNLVDVSGTIKLDGEPVEGAVVVFEDVETGLQSYALTNSSGGYTLKFDSVKNGIIPGEKKVIVSTTLKVLGLNSDEEGGEANEEAAEKQEPVELIPDAYHGDSKLRVTVSESSGTIDFDLAGDGSTAGPA